MAKLSSVNKNNRRIKLSNKFFEKSVRKFNSSIIFIYWTHFSHS